MYGVADTLKSLEMGAVETLIVWDNLDINRYVLRNITIGEIVVKNLHEYQEANQTSELKVEEKKPLLEWLADEYRNFGCTLGFVTDKSQEGSQFCKGLGGIGGVLRYPLDIRSYDDMSDSDDEEICDPV